MFEHAEQEPGLARGAADRFRSDAGQRQKAPEPLGLAGDEAQGGDREPCRGVLLFLRIRSARSRAWGHGVVLANCRASYTPDCTTRLLGSRALAGDALPC